MSWQDGDMIEVEIGDGNGHVHVNPDSWLVWCRRDGETNPLVLQWRSDDPVPPEGTRVTVEYRQNGLFYPSYPHAPS